MQNPDGDETIIEPPKSDGDKLSQTEKKKVDTSLICNKCGYTANNQEEIKEHKEKLCSSNTPTFRSRGTGGQSLGALDKYNDVK